MSAPGLSQTVTPDVAAVVEWLRRLLAPDQVVELRALGVRTAGAGRSHTEAGFFDADHLHEMARLALELTRRARGVYFTLNPLRPEILARRCNRIDWAAAGELAKDQDVLARRWLLVDVDPIRDSHISATDAEKARAHDTSHAVRDFLRSRSWPDPILADSGNGYHLLYQVELPADDGGVVRRLLQVLANLFDDESVRIDQAVGNAARLCKLPGTWARKGDAIVERPFRRAALLDVPQRIEVVSQEAIESLAAQASPPRPVSPPGSRGSSSTHSRLLVERWLHDHGIGFRVKAEPDTKGRMVYVLKACPFDESHADPDACIMQAPDGQLSAKCFHNSCHGRGWQAFKHQIGVPQPHHYDPPLAQIPNPHPAQRTGAGVGQGLGGTPSHDTGLAVGILPRIQGNRRQLREVTADALAALVAANDPPVVFHRGGVLTRLRGLDNHAAPTLEPLATDALRGVLARVADWVNVRETRNGPLVEPVAPHREVVADLSHLPAWPELPELDAVVDCPVFDPDGRLVLDPGYHAAARVWYHPPAGFDLPVISEQPTDTQITQARELLVDELLGEFPFADDASRAHALAAVLLPFVRRMIDGPTPLHLFDAPTEGTGKTLLASLIAVVATGRDIEAIPEADSDAEWRKRITSVLLDGGPVVLFDNLNRSVDAGALAAALTSRTWKDRILGVSKMTALPNHALWLATGNNASLSRELIRRTVWCRLDARVDAPWERTGFRHPNLIGWAKSNRGQLVGAALTLGRAWIACGRPRGTEVLGQFEAWTAVMGGLLEVAGVRGLLANAPTLRAVRADAASELRAFAPTWWATFADQAVGVESLFRLAVAEQLLDEVLGDKGERSQRTRLGRALGKAVDQVYGQYRLERVGVDHKSRQQYRLRLLAEVTQELEGQLP